MSAVTLDEEMLSTLTDEERDAVAGNDYSPEELAAMKAVAGDDGDGDDDDDVGGGQETDADGGQAADQVAADAPPADTPAQVDDSAPAKPVVRYEAQLPADYADKVAALQQESDDLAAKFRDGAIDIDEFQAESQAIASRRDDLVIQRTKAEISSEMVAQSAEQEWEGMVAKFVNDTKGQSIDYTKNTSALEDLDQFVRLLSNKDEHADKSGEWFLKEAHKRVVALHGVAPAAVDKETPDKPTPPPRKPPVAAIPATLAQVPGADGVGDLAGEFADVENLEGFELEQAIHRMTPAQRERFAAGR